VSANLDRPLIVQGDHTLLLEANHPLFEQAREQIIKFAELVKSPEYIHTYRLTPLSLWNAAANGLADDQIIGYLKRYSKFEVPQHIKKEIRGFVNRYGIVSFEMNKGSLILKSKMIGVIDELIGYDSINKYFKNRINEFSIIIDQDARGILKQEILKVGYPVRDLAGYQEGEPLDISLLSMTKKGEFFRLRDYQLEAVTSFYAGGTVYGGSGTLVLPCGSGKTVIGLGVMTEIKNETLILTTNITAVHQWIQELLDKTTLTSKQIGEYTGELKEVKPVTVTTYQILTHRSDINGEFSHMKIFQQRNWGLIIYDEVHLLPAPIFRYTANIQAKRRLGLTATLIREDNKEEDVFTLIGPKKFDVPWIQMEDKGWIAKASCTEIRLPLAKDWNQKYILASKRQKYHIAATNPLKIAVLKKILAMHADDSVLIIGQYLEQLEQIAKQLQAPLITGKVKQNEREQIYHDFKKGKIKILIVSKVANFAIDLPDAKVAIQVSGTFGSRQEEAQRLGRILRPKKVNNEAFFYTLISQNTIDQDYAMKRQLFLIDQGYKYQITEEETV